MKNPLKYFLFLIICLGLACLSFSCVAPGTGNSGQSDEGGGPQSEQSHVHDFAIKKSDAYYHWQECECGEKSSMGAHAGGEATCVERAICTVCLSPYGSYGEHSLSGKSDNEFHWQECVCGETTTKTAHYGGSATCTELAVCAGCGTAYGETLSHNHTELKFDGEGHWYECSCGDKGEKTAHGGGEATCTELAKCSICGTAYGEMANHNHTELKFDGEEHWYECACGDIINKEKHYGGAPTYTDKPICEGCGTAYGERLVTNLEKDQAKVKEFNLVLAENACENIAEVKKLLVTSGFDASEFIPLDSSNEFYWVAEINIIIIASEENNAIYPEGLIALAEQSKDGWYSLSGRDKNGTVSMITSAINSGEKLEGTINLMGASINLKPTADIVIGGADGDPATIQNLVSDEGTKANANANNEYVDNIYYTSLVSTVPAGKTVIVENLVIDGAVVGDTFANISETARNGIIAGQVAGTLIIRNVTIKNSIVFGGYRIGGLVGSVAANATVIIENVTLDNVTVKGQTNVALLIGDVKANSKISIKNVAHVNCDVEAIDIIGIESFVIENELITYTKNNGEYKQTCAHVTTKYFWVNHGVRYHNADHVPGGEGADWSKYGWTSDDVAMSESWNYHEHSYTKLRTDSNYHWYECSCGDTSGVESHYGGTATETEQAICEGCGEPYGECVHEAFTEGLVFTLLDNNTYSVTDYTGTAADVVIPSLYKGLPVTTIGDRAFYSCYVLSSVKIGDRVTVIEEYAFCHCTALESVEMGASVTTIELAAFYYCAFLKSVEMSDSVTTIGDFAFRDCKYLTSIEIGDRVTTIGEYAFYSCYSLTSITVSEHNTVYKSIDGNLYSKDGTALIQYAIGKEKTSFTIPESVTEIGTYAVAFCDSLTSIEIGDRVTTIGEYAFYTCYGLTSITVSEHNIVYKSIDGNLYSKDGTALIQYAIGKTATSFTIPESVTEIGTYAFAFCGSLTSIEIGNVVTMVGTYAFDSCGGLRSVKIGDNAIIGEGAFARCGCLTDITVSENNAAYKSIDGNLYTKDGSILIKYAGGKNATTFTIPESVTAIGGYAFSHSYNLISVEIPDSVTSIGDCAFYNCNSLTSIEIPDSVTSIGYAAFDYCSSLTSVYYKGTEAKWSEISIGSGNETLTFVPIYYYSETQPTDGGNYWHYDKNGEVVVW